MKTKILFLALILAEAAVAFQMNVKHERMDNVMLENLEALSSDEWDGLILCVGSGCVDCPTTHVKVYLVSEVSSPRGF